jgi:hypothetical protein
MLVVLYDHLYYTVHLLTVLQLSALLLFIALCSGHPLYIQEFYSSTGKISASLLVIRSAPVINN